jgi:hypothetical protein
MNRPSHPPLQPDASFSVVDGSIQGISSRPGLLRVEFIDWQEQPWVLSFNDLVAFQSLGAEGSQIAELSTAAMPLLMAQVDPQELTSSPHSYSFICAWSARPVLSVIAGSYHCERASQPEAATWSDN